MRRREQGRGVGSGGGWAAPRALLHATEGTAGEGFPRRQCFWRKGLKGVREEPWDLSRRNSK